MKALSATLDLSLVPKSGIESFISSLAKDNGGTYLGTPHDKLASVIASALNLHCDRKSAQICTSIRRRPHI
jgi:hypothetical protein